MNNMIEVLHTKDFISFFIGASANLTANKERINALNVFPVPDGDTGTNMGLTMSSAVRDVPAQTNITDAAKVLAHGALLGARGNSGVILSQILRGFAQGVDGTDELRAADFARAMQKGVELAYKSVMRPVEGTILTVARKMAEAAAAAVDAQQNIGVEALLEDMLQYGYKALAETTEQLPVLKQAGVVDSGASGLIAIFEGGLRAVRGEEFEIDLNIPGKADFTQQPVSDVDDHSDLVNHYCTEFFIHGQDIDVDAYRAHLQDMGESQVIVGNETVVKTHIHTADPGAVLSYALQFGSLHDLKIDNMKDQHRETLITEEDKLEDMGQALTGALEQPEPVELPACGVVVVSSGDGLDQIFREMGAVGLVSGGQSMNPSAEDILQAIQSVPAQEIVLLPNNSNIIMAATQAGQIADKPVAIVPSKFITQGIAAMMDFDPERTAEENAAAMQEAMSDVRNGQITYAVRDSQFDGQEIHEGDILGLLDGKIAVVEPDIEAAVLALLPLMFNDETSLITLLYGEGVDEDAAAALSERLAEEFPDYELDVQPGGQAVYHYLVSVE